MRVSVGKSRPIDVSKMAQECSVGRVCVNSPFGCRFALDKGMHSQNMSLNGSNGLQQDREVRII